MLSAVEWAILTLALISACSPSSAGQPKSLLISTPSASEGQLRQATPQTRPTNNDIELRYWLANMAWHHRYSIDEMVTVTGLPASEVESKLAEFKITESVRPARDTSRLFVLPYPGGRHPRIGFLDGAVEPQRETKLSVFCPWDDTSYVVADFPEAIWSNLGLTYLAHTHVPTVWSKQGIELPRQEWIRNNDGSFTAERTLPNGISFGTKAIPMKDHVRFKMWLTNGTKETLTDLRVQNCVMLKGAAGFEQQTKDNKQFHGCYAVAHSPDKSRWIITGWEPIHRAWGNPPCPCLHADPKFEDCPPGETKFLRGWLSFHEGTNISAELARVDSTGWKQYPLHHVTGNVTGRVIDVATKTPVPCRLYVQNVDTGDFHFARSTAVAGSAVVYNKQTGNTPSIERHVTLSADPFQLDLKPGRYRIRAERGKEFLPAETEIIVPPATSTDIRRAAGSKPDADITLELKRFTDMTSRGWYSGDTHVHRTMADLPNAVLAEDVNVVFPLNYWVRDSREIPSASGPPLEARVMAVDPTHLIYPINTEYEIFTVEGKRHTQGAVFVLNHQTPLNLPAPPALPVAEEARRQGAILDLDKHSWAWSLMIIPVMNVDLFELSNNHNWRTQFGFPQWTLENAPDWPEVERNDKGFTELGWTEFAMQTYYSLLNCGVRMRVTGGTASGVHPVPLAHGRVYVHINDNTDASKLNYDRWIEGLNAGRSFVTTGPLMDLRFSDQHAGTTLKPSAGTVTVTGRIDSVNPLRTIEFIRNGEIVRALTNASVKSASGSFVTEVRESITVESSGWLAVRCFEDLPNNKVSFAHSNPVLIDIEDRPLIPRRRDAKFFVQRMDAEITRNTGTLSDEALAEYRQARAFYQAVLDRAKSPVHGND